MQEPVGSPDVLKLCASSGSWVQPQVKNKRGETERGERVLNWLRIRLNFSRFGFELKIKCVWQETFLLTTHALSSLITTRANKHSSYNPNFIDDNALLWTESNLHFQHFFALYALMLHDSIHEG